MFQYTISKIANNEDFLVTSNIIESFISNFEKCELLIDVDGSLFQKYIIHSGEIIVQSDYDVDAVYVDSEIEIPDLTKYLIMIN